MHACGPGAVVRHHDEAFDMVQTWQDALERAIRMGVEEGHLKPDTDPAQMLFEVHGLILALHHDARFLRHPGAVDRATVAFRRVLENYAAPGALESKPAVRKRAARS